MTTARLPAIDVLLSTYQGASYLGTQLSSLRRQTCPPLRVLVRDDQSPDSTPLVLRHWAEDWSAIHLLPDDQQIRGATGSFQHLIRTVRADEDSAPLVAFCDQDDEWLPEKLERAAQWHQDLGDADRWSSPADVATVLKCFDDKCDMWSSLDANDDEWSMNWACKEVLKHVRMNLASRSSGWWSVPSIPGLPVDWANMNRAQSDAHDRFIERELQPKLIHRVASRLADPAIDDPLSREMNELKQAILGR